MEDERIFDESLRIEVKTTAGGAALRHPPRLKLTATDLGSRSG